MGDQLSGSSDAGALVHLGRSGVSTTDDGDGGRTSVYWTQERAMLAAVVEDFSEALAALLPGTKAGVGYSVCLQQTAPG